MGSNSPSRRARRLKTLKGLTPYEYICKCCASQPERFKLNPLQQMPGLNTERLSRILSMQSCPIMVQLICWHPSAIWLNIDGMSNIAGPALVTSRVVPFSPPIDDLVPKCVGHRLTHLA